MPRHVITLRSDRDRKLVTEWVQRAAPGYRVEVREPKRSDAQNDRLWAMLAVVARHGEINGRKFQPESWKCIFMQALGKEGAFLPTLGGDGFFPMGFRSSELSVREMSDLQTYIEAWAAERGIDLGGPS